MQTLPYKQLLADLDIANVRELEDMIIECMYADLIVGKLDQKRLVLEVQHAVARDIGPSDIRIIADRLDDWFVC